MNPQERLRDLVISAATESLVKFESLIQDRRYGFDDYHIARLQAIATFMGHVPGLLAALDPGGNEREQDGGA